MIVMIVYHNQVRNLSRSLLVERLGGLAVSGELNVPSLPSLAIVQVLDDNINEDNLTYCCSKGFRREIGTEGGSAWTSNTVFNQSGSCSKSKPQ